jgi:hypothetical protein
MKGLSAAVAVALVLVIAAQPAAADHPGNGGHHGGDNSGGQYSAWAYYARATGGGRVTQPVPCTLSGNPDVPAFIEYNVISYDGGATYTVWKDCVALGEILDDRRGLFPDGESAWDILDSWQVTPAEPQVMIDEALARLDPTPPRIVTDPGDGRASLVGINTHLSLAEPVQTETVEISDGPITIQVRADPVGDVEWDTGDGVEACNGTGAPEGGCAHEYGRSSAGESGSDDSGRPSYHITATVNYIGSYVVLANGAVVGGDDDIGGITRVSETFLAVDEAQALND